MEKYLLQKADEINKEMEKFVPVKPGKEWLEFIDPNAKYGYDADTIQESINKPLRDFLDRGGKRWRPALMFLSCEAVGGKSGEVKEFSVLPELVHNGTIIADDLEDNSLFRRGKPTLHRIYGADIALNAGNSLYFLPLKVVEKRLLSEGKSFEKKALDIYRLYNDEMIRLSFGQAMDIYWHRGSVRTITEEQYLQMCVYKTGSLAKFSAELGAILGGGSEKQISVLGDFAASIGVAFQIQDDVMNIAPPKGWGKEIGDDINEGKRTLLVIHALENSSKAKADRLIEILGSHTDKEEEILEAIRIIKESGAVDYANRRAKEIIQESWKKLDKEIRKSPAKETLKSFSDYVVERKI